MGVYAEWAAAAKPKWASRAVNWRAVAAEFIGMTLFVFGGCATAVFTSNPSPTAYTTDASGDTQPGTVAGATLLGLSSVVSSAAPFGTNTALAFGIGIVVLAYAIGHVSGGHLNPAVSFGLLLAGAVGPAQAAANVVAQCVGAILAAAFIKGVLPSALRDTSSLGANTLSRGYTSGNAFLGEAIMTTLLVFVVLQTAVCRTGSAAVRNLAPLAIGFAVLVSHTVLIPVTGCSINPARSLGPAVVSDVDTWSNFWVFVFAPLTGSIFGWLAWLAVSKEWDAPPAVDLAAVGVDTPDRKKPAAASP